MATGRVNIGGGGGGLNVYAQLTEPRNKEGIWVKTDAKAKKVINDLKMWFENTWLAGAAIDEYPPLPVQIGFETKMVPYKDYIYMFLGGTINSRTVYRFNTITKLWSVVLTDAPMDLNQTWKVYKGNMVYIFGFTQGYSYNLETGIWTEIAVNPQTKHLGGYTTVVGEYIYALGGSISYAGTMDTSAEVYDIQNNVWTNMNLPTGTNIAGRRASALTYGNGFFALGGFITSAGGEFRFRYFDLATNAFTSLPSLPRGTGRPLGVIIDNHVYVRFDSSFFYKYNIDTGLWTAIPGAPDGGNSSLSIMFVKHKDMLYTNAYLNMAVYTFTTKSYEEGTMIIVRRSDKIGSYYTELSSVKDGIQGVYNRLLSSFDDAFIYYDGELQEDSFYYGDGTQWIRFKN